VVFSRLRYHHYKGLFPFFFLEEPKFCDLEVQLLFLMLLSPFLEPFWFQLLPNDISVRCDGRSKEFVAAFG